MADFAIFNVEKPEVFNHRAQDFRIGVQLIGDTFDVVSRAISLTLSQILDQ